MSTPILNYVERRQKFLIFLSFFIVTILLIIIAESFYFENHSKNNEILKTENNKLREVLKINQKHLADVDSIFSIIQLIHGLSDITRMEHDLNSADSYNNNKLNGLQNDSTIGSDFLKRYFKLSNSTLLILRENMKAKKSEENYSSIITQLSECNEKVEKIEKDKSDLEKRLNKCLRICKDCD